MLGGGGGKGLGPCAVRSELNTFENVWGGACTVGQGRVMYGGGRTRGLHRDRVQPGSCTVGWSQSQGPVRGAGQCPVHGSPDGQND